MNIKLLRTGDVDDDKSMTADCHFGFRQLPEITTAQASLLAIATRQDLMRYIIAGANTTIPR